MDLSDCYRKGQIKKTRVDKGLIRSLIEMSGIKESTVKEAKLTEKNISVYVCVAYDSLREILEAVCIYNGYKVLSHICIGELLRKIVPDFDYVGFDRMRYIRNAINYYGTKADFEQGKQIIEKIFKMRKDILEKHIKDI
ncbi:MAG: hypothetical protein KAJ24_05970 [Candidatus Aenigmarchaeota archaeon]|nr:hypothetical protein [Candidatus Aenigmarchaeota archaeon]